MKGAGHMKEKNKKLRPESDIDKVIEPHIVVSSTEATGMIPTPPMSEAEAKSYTEIYGVPQPKVKIADDDRNSKKRNG